MTLNEIKLSTLMLMFTNYGDDLRDCDVDEMTDSTYTKYTVNMDASINRALSRIEAAKVLPLKTVVLTPENAVKTENKSRFGDYLTRWDLSSLASDFSAVCRVAEVSSWGYVSSISYEMEGNTIVLPNISEYEGEYSVLYYYRPKRINPASPSSTVIDVPDYIAEIIPYWVKADLYEEDEPSAAVAARNIFEQMLSDIVRPDSNGQGSVKNNFIGVI